MNWEQEGSGTMETSARGKEREQRAAREAAGTQRETAGTLRGATGSHGKQREATLTRINTN